MTSEQLFSLASTAAMVGWACLLLSPRHRLVIAGLRYGLVGGLALTYAVLIALYFFRIAGGGFGSIAEVRALFLSDGGLLAGWIHYLAFDLFVGMWIATEADKAGVSRWLQAPMLVATFMLGPLGLILFYLTRATETALEPRKV